MGLMGDGDDWMAEDYCPTAFLQTNLTTVILCLRVLIFFSPEPDPLPSKDTSHKTIFKLSVSAPVSLIYSPAQVCLCTFLSIKPVALLS